MSCAMSQSYHVVLLIFGVGQHVKNVDGPPLEGSPAPGRAAAVLMRVLL